MARSYGSARSSAMSRPWRNGPIQNACGWKFGSGRTEKLSWSKHAERNLSNLARNPHVADVTIPVCVGIQFWPDPFYCTLKMLTGLLVLEALATCWKMLRRVGVRPVQRYQPGVSWRREQTAWINNHPSRLFPASLGLLKVLRPDTFNIAALSLQ